MRRLAAALVAAGFGLGPSVAAYAAAPAPVPPGYRVAQRDLVAPGVVHQHLVRRSPEQSVHVARVAPDAAVDLRVVRAPRASDGRALERTSAACRRVRCLVAVNGDFFDPDTGDLVGGLVTGGVPLRSPNSRHHQLAIGPDGSFSAGVQRWTGSLVPTDLRELAVTGVNVPRGRNAVVLYTPAYGGTTGTNTHGAELVATAVVPKPPLRLGQTTLVKLTGLRERKPGARIPADGVVLSGHGAGAKALQDLWRRVKSGAAGRHALLRIESDPPVVESIGGAPVLVRGGRRYVATTGPAFVTGRHPRTAVGWTRRGELLLVTVDGRRPGHSRGMSLAELADLMVGLGAVEALNLDGGGSTTFARSGRVVNRPSDRLVRRYDRDAVTAAAQAGESVLGDVERPVGNVLAVVPEGGPRRAADPLGGGRVDLPIDARAPTALDPGSDPAGARPALVAAEPPRRADRPIGFAVGLVSGLSLATAAALLRPVGGRR